MFFLLACVQDIFLSISDSNFRCGTSKSLFSYGRYCKIGFSWKSFLMNFGIVFWCFVDALGAVFMIFEVLKTSLNTKRFLVKSRILIIGSDGADPGVFGPSKDMKA